MIEVFKTSVCNTVDAQRLITLIHASFPAYRANFDLDDCDNILRIVTTQIIIHPAALISLLNGMGFDAEILPDEVPATKNSLEITATGRIQASRNYTPV